MKYPAVWIGCFYLLGLMAGFMVLPPWICLIVALAVSVGCAIGWQKFRYLLLLACFLFGVARSVMAEQHYDRLVNPLDGKEIRFQGVICEIPQWLNEENSRYELRVERIQTAGISREISLRMQVSASGNYEIGERMVGSAMVYSADCIPATIGFSYGDFLKQQGVDLHGYVLQWQSKGTEKLSLIDRIKQARVRGAAVVQRYLRSPAEELVIAMTLGDRSFLTDQQQLAFSRTGLSHTMAVSGLHVSWLLLCLLWLLRTVRCPLRMSAFLSCVFLLLCIPFFGFSFSVVRAVIMGTLGLLGIFFFRETQAWNSLVIAAILILVWQPYAWADIGCVLSFLSTAGILLYASPVKGWLEETILPRAYAGSLSLSIAACLSTFLITAWSFHQISLWAPVANLVLAPLFPVSLIGAVLLLLFHVVCPPIAVFLGKGLEAFVGFGYGILKTFSSFSGGVVVSGIPDVTVILFYFALLLLLYLLCSPKKKRWLWGVLLALWVGGVGTFVWKPSETVFTVADTGNVSTRMAELPTDICVVWMGGNGKSGSAEYAAQSLCTFLNSRGVTEIDVLCLTEYNDTSMFVLRTLCQTYGVKHVFGFSLEEQEQEICRNILRRSNATFTVPSHGMTLPLDEEHRLDLFPEGAVRLRQGDQSMVYLSRLPEGGGKILCGWTNDRVSIEQSVYAIQEGTSLSVHFQEGQIQKINHRGGKGVSLP